MIERAMPQFVTADPPLIERIHDGTFTIWSEGLSRPDYSIWQQAQLDSPWGRAHLRRVALVDDGELLASAKRYDFSADIGGEPCEVLGIGAVFTPPAHRGRRYAQRLIDAMLADAADRGCRAALLFSEIGPAYYERLGFEVIRRDELVFECPVEPDAHPVARAGRREDLPAMAALSAGTRTPSTFALNRSPDLVDFGLIRRGTLADLSMANRLVVEWLVVEDAGRMTAFLIATRRPRGLVIEDCGDVDPSGAHVASLIASLATQSSFHAPVVHGWLPERFRGWTTPGLWHDATDNVMMIRPVGQTTVPRIDGPVTFWNLDLF